MDAGSTLVGSRASRAGKIGARSTAFLLPASQSTRFPCRRAPAGIRATRAILLLETYHRCARYAHYLKPQGGSSSDCSRRAPLRINWFILIRIERTHAVRGAAQGPGARCAATLRTIRVTSTIVQRRCLGKYPRIFRHSEAAVRPEIPRLGESTSQRATPSIPRSSPGYLDWAASQAEWREPPCARG